MITYSVTSANCSLGILKLCLRGRAPTFLPSSLMMRPLTQDDLLPWGDLNSCLSHFWSML